MSLADAILGSTIALCLTFLVERFYRTRAVSGAIVTGCNLLSKTIESAVATVTSGSGDDPDPEELAEVRGEIADEERS